jgi:MoxR-like ATPase
MSSKIDNFAKSSPVLTRYYTGDPKNRRERPAVIPESSRSRQRAAEQYIADPKLVDAFNVALILGQPLLLTGEPGTGKTLFAYNAALELGLFPPLIFETKSTSNARDLFYTYDTLGRFHAAQTGEGSQNSVDYITFNALGIAILRANDETEVKDWLPEDFEHGGKRRSVVLIDEIDKAPRDFPNDILNEVENMYFKVPELKNKKFEAEDAMRPILILTSNSERNLPDAFLRRCVYYNIAFPNKERLKEIVIARIPEFKDGSAPMLTEALDLFYELRNPNSGIHKKPATDEVLAWLTTLREMGLNIDSSLRDHREKISSSLSTLVKNYQDQPIAEKILEDWWLRKRG